VSSVPKGSWLFKTGLQALFLRGGAVAEASASGKPVLPRVQPKAGHGAGRPPATTIAAQTDVWCFICRQLGVDPIAHRT
jgi:hypothetical protein